jgi:hypothetical protein
MAGAVPGAQASSRLSAPQSLPVHRSTRVPTVRASQRVTASRRQASGCHRFGSARRRGGPRHEARVSRSSVRDQENDGGADGEYNQRDGDRRADGQCDGRPARHGDLREHRSPDRRWPGGRRRRRGRPYRRLRPATGVSGGRGRAIRLMGVGWSRDGLGTPVGQCRAASAAVAAADWAGPAGRARRHVTWHGVRSGSLRPLAVRS